MTSVRLTFLFANANEREEIEADLLLQHLRMRANRRLLEEQNAIGAAHAHATNLRKWIKVTRRTAGEAMPAYRNAAEIMLAAADAMQLELDWPGRNRLTHPPLDAGAVARIRTTLDLWLFDRIRATLDPGGKKPTDIPPMEEGRVRWVAYATNAREEAIDAPALRQRVARLAAKIRRGEKDNLVADLLEDCRTEILQKHQ